MFSFYKKKERKKIKNVTSELNVNVKSESLLFLLAKKKYKKINISW
jgi:hypothetical protein